MPTALDIVNSLPTLEAYLEKATTDSIAYNSEENQMLRAYEQIAAVINLTPLTELTMRKSVHVSGPLPAAARDVLIAKGYTVYGGGGNSLDGTVVSW